MVVDANTFSSKINTQERKELIEKSEVKEVYARKFDKFVAAAQLLQSVTRIYEMKRMLSMR